MYDPLYEAAVRLDVPLAVHGGSSAGLGLDLYDSFVKILVMEHAVAQQIHFTSYLLDGGPVRFPGLKIAFLEAGVGWVPYLIERLDENSKSSRSRLFCYPMSRAIMSDLSNLFFLRARRKNLALRNQPRIREKRSCIRLITRMSAGRSKSFLETFLAFARGKNFPSKTKN